MGIKAFLLCGLLLLAKSGFAAELRDIVLKQESDRISLNFQIEGSFIQKSFMLGNPERLVVDLHPMRSFPIKLSQYKRGSIKGVRIGHPDADTLRLVFDLDSRAKMTAAVQNQVLKIQLNRVASGIPLKATAKPSEIRQPPDLKDKPIAVRNSPVANLRDVVVVIDAGHGGKDPGAHGPKRSLEKHVVLAIALKLKQLIDRQPGMRAVMTRKGDYYVGLRQRLDIARKYNGDIFVSIHADAFINQHSSGASVFALSQSGATSEAARWIAEKENYSELGGVNLADLDDQNGVVRSVLIDLSQTATIGSSLQMGGRVLKHLGSMTGLHNHRVEQARFMVLKSPDTPSILVETGFISNPREEANLNNSAYQTRLSQSIFQGIKGYFWDYPPQGTRVEAMAAKTRHIVRAGETLPLIAAGYHISLAALESMNPAVARKPLKAGQKLIVPSQWG